MMFLDVLMLCINDNSSLIYIIYIRIFFFFSRVLGIAKKTTAAAEAMQFMPEYNQAF